MPATNRGPYACLHGRIPLKGAPAPRYGTPPDGYTIAYAPVGALAIGPDMMEGLNSITPHAKAGRVRALGVSGATRSPALPDVPTIAEAGVPGYEATTWNGIVAPAGAPRAVVAKLNADINRALATPSLREKFAAIGAEPANSTPEQFAELIRKEYARWGDVIRRSGARID